MARSRRLLRLPRLALACLLACGGHRRATPEPIAEPAAEVMPAEVVTPALPEGTHPLRRFFAALDRLDRGDPEAVATIVQLGASHTASDTFTGPLRRRLQARFGDAGRGFAAPGRPWKTFVQFDTGYSMEGPWWVTRGPSNRPERPLGLAGVRLDAVSPGASITRSTCTDCAVGAVTTGFELHVVETPIGGSLRIAVDGVPWGVRSTRLSDPAPDRPPEPPSVDPTTEPLIATAPPEGPPPPVPADGRLGFVRIELPEGPHELRLETVGDGLVTLLGVDELGSAPGVRLHALGINGLRVDQFSAFDDDLVAAELARLDPDLLILDWGTNEMFSEATMPRDRDAPASAWDAAAEGYGRVLTEHVEALRRAVPDADCVVLMPPDLAPSTDPTRGGARVDCAEELVDPRLTAPYCVRPRLRTEAPVRAVQRRVAVDVGCAVYDQQAAMGGSGSDDLWRALTPPLAKSDGIHLTMRGYALLADAFDDALIDAWTAWRTTHADTPLPSPTIPPERLTATP